MVKVKVGPITAQYKGRPVSSSGTTPTGAVLQAEGGTPGARATPAPRSPPRSSPTATAPGQGGHRSDRHRQGRAVRPGRDGRRERQAAGPVRRLPGRQGAGGRSGRAGAAPAPTPMRAPWPSECMQAGALKPPPPAEAALRDEAHRRPGGEAGRPHGHRRRTDGQGVGRPCPGVLWLLRLLLKRRRR